MHNISNLIFSLVSFILSTVFFAVGMALFLVPIGLLMDLVDASPGYPGVIFMVGLAGIAGIGFGLGMAWYLRHLDRQLVMPDPFPGEYIRFRQYGYAITSKKYDPAKIVITNQRLFILPTHFNAGPRIADFIVDLDSLRTLKDKSFGKRLADKKIPIQEDRIKGVEIFMNRRFGQDIGGRFLLLKFKKKLVFHSGGQTIAYMPNLGYPLPPLRLFKPAPRS